MTNELTFFNTQARTKEPFQPREAGKVQIYTCGPTVYSFAHIGNFRTYVFEDLLRRTLKFFGYAVEQVMNITDVDDKTIREANKEGTTLENYVARYEKAFFEDLETLKIDPAEHYPEATDYIDEMIVAIEKLIASGHAYKGEDGSVYYAIAKFPGYGKLSNLKLNELQTGASDRVAADEYDKDNASDFVLWKGYDEERDGPIFWESPFGKGRPGWHLECSVMAMEILGASLDIHCGGVDNIFPHHENEIAQSEACTGKQFVRYWLHAEHLIVEGKKMSKSLGNFYTLRDLMLKGYTGPEVRYMLLHCHYRTQLNFTFEGLAAVRASLGRLQSFVARLQEKQEGPGGRLTTLIPAMVDQFKAALADDLNISVALAHLFDFVRDANTLLDSGEVSSLEAAEALDTLRKLDTILCVLDFEEQKTPPEILELMEKRQAARAAKDWAAADAFRDEILGRGYLIEDTPQGIRVKKS